MAQGDPDNVNIWADADVLIGPLDAEDPAIGADFSADWDFAGILNGDQGFAAARESDQTDHFGWGAGIVAQTDRNYKETKTFTAMESNEVIKRLIYPGSDFSFDPTGAAGDSGTLKVPTREKFKIAFVTRNGTVTERHISKNYAMLEGWPTPSQNESDPETVEVTSVIYPTAGAEKELWTWQRWDSDKLTP